MPAPNTLVGVAPPPSNTFGSKPGVDMNWDDDDEKTHIYEGRGDTKERDGKANGASASSLPAPMPPPTKSSLPPPVAPPPHRNSERHMVPPPRKPPNGVPGTQVAVTAPIAPVQASPVERTERSSPAIATTTVPVRPPRQIGTPPIAPPPRPPLEATQPIEALRPNRISPGSIVIGSIALAAVAGFGGYSWMSTRPGTVLVSVDAKNAPAGPIKVLLDGQEKCADTTCRIADVPKGKHIVKAVAGEAQATAPIDVEAGKDTLASLVLEAPKKAATGVKLAAASKQRDIALKVEIDGSPARALPLEDDTLKPGSHKLRFSGPERYGVREMDVVLGEGEMRSIDNVTIPLKSVKTRFIFVGRGIRAQLNDGSKTIDLKDDGQPVELDASKSYTVTATAPGMQEFSKPIEFGEEPDMVFRIEPTERARPAPVGVGGGGGETTPTPTPTPTPAAPPPTPAAASTDGFLVINSVPASKCIVNGQPKGATPLRLKVPPGSYSVTCVTKDGDEVKKKSGSATVDAGQEAKVMLRL